jgi:hypothetical protein
VDLHAGLPGTLLDSTGRITELRSMPLKPLSMYELKPADATNRSFPKHQSAEQHTESLSLTMMDGLSVTCRHRAKYLW